MARSSWFSVQSDIGAAGRITVIAGTLDGRVVIQEDIDLPANAPAQGGAFASPPYASAVDADRFVVGYFDGRASHLLLGSVTDASLREVLSVDAYVIHHAVVAADGRTAYAALATQVSAVPGETGIWRIDLGTGAVGQRLAGPVEPPVDPPRGFFERLFLTPNGSHLAAWRCTRTCVLRVFDTSTGNGGQVGDSWPGGDVAGITNDAFIVSDRDCAEPCRWQRISLATGEVAELGAGAGTGAAVVAANAVGFDFVFEHRTATDGVFELTSIDLETSAQRTIGTELEEGLALVPASDTYGARIPAGSVLLGPEGRLSGRLLRIERPEVPFPALLDSVTGQRRTLPDLGQ